MSLGLLPKTRDHYIYQYHNILSFSLKSGIENNMKEARDLKRIERVKEIERIIRVKEVERITRVKEIEGSIKEIS